MNREELLEKYLQEKLSPQEKVIFDELIATDATFKEEVAWQSDLKKAIIHEDNDNFKALLTEIEAKKPIPKRGYTKWLAAASILLLVGFSYLFFTTTNSTTDDLFADYFEPYRNVIQPIERGSSQQDEKTVAFTAYEKGNYEKAVDLFTKLYGTSNESYYLFYKANALLKLNKANEAIPVLLEHLKTKDTLTEKTNWYLALAYLKVDKKNMAKTTLKKVADDGNYKNKEAKELLKKFE